MKWIIAILIFSLLILFHEFGHFLVAKLNGVDVIEFSLGFGPRLLSTEYKGTRYSLKVLPFGGSCQMKGMYDEFEEEESSRPHVIEDGSFESVSVGRRAAIVVAGPFFNFLLAFLCAVVIISFVGYDPALVLSVTEGSPAEEAGLAVGDTITSFMGSRVDIGRDVDTYFVLHDLKEGMTVKMKARAADGTVKDITYTTDVLVRYMMGITYQIDGENAFISSVSENSPIAQAGVQAGDIITSINGEEITTAESLNAYFEAHPMDGSEVALTYLHDGLSYDTTLVPVENRTVQLGFIYNLYRDKTTSLGVLKYGLIELRYWIGTTIKSLGAMFTGRFGVNDLSGPVGVVDIVGTTYEETKDEGPLMTWLNMLNLIVLLSANLGVMNLLPIPAIDGGRLVFLFIEGILHRPINQKISMAIQTVTVVLLMILMVYVMYNDLMRMLVR